MEKKGPFTIQELKSLPTGSQLWGKYLVLEKSQRKTKDGRDVINLKLGDATGEVDAVIWDNCQVSGPVEAGTLLGVLGDLGSYNNKLQLTAKRIKALDEDISPYLKKPDINIEVLIEKFNRLLAQIADPALSKLMEALFTPEVRKEFYEAAAAKKVHHNYPGGLLEHTVQVAELCLYTAPAYPLLNKDLLIAGALLHDIGKLDEYQTKVVTEYTVKGRLLGHIAMGVERVGIAIEEVRSQGQDFSRELEWMLKHMILSHHGTTEFGSPVVPMFPEAFVLHMMDNLDAKMFVYWHKIKDTEDGDEYFSTYDNFFQQQFFKYRLPDSEPS
ncbi:MAG TPA: HD domain-containing protein [Syntrophomonadaceae bacterium]|nr:HD domain-containing protein [Syntrophomonadaceae bacterium]HOQ08559.1 HD domain-containing protein [Syntrophomonadaceae bacterium]HPU49216.1 HD domain-containing protein [Syntrophomonadaceae bacterium]